MSIPSCIIYGDIVNCFDALVSTESFRALRRDSEVAAKVKEFRVKKRYIDEEKMADNRLCVCGLKDIFIALQKLVFKSSPCQLLYDLINIFMELFPNEVPEIVEFMTVYGFSDFSNKRILLKGDVQSGKTLTMILTALCYLICGRDVVFILRNKIADKLQLIKRFGDIFQKLRERKEYSFFFSDFKIVDKKDSPPRKNCIFIDIYSKINVKRLKKKLMPRNICNAVLYVDEADCRNDSKDAEFTDFCSMIGTNIFVSATVQDILVSKWGIKGNYVISLKQKKDYKGIEDLNIITERDVQNVDELLWTFCDISVDEEYLAAGNATHPKIVLVTIDRELNKISDIFNNFKSNVFRAEGITTKLPNEMKNPCVIEYTGKGVKIYHKVLDVNNLRGLSPRLICEDGNFLLPSKISIGETLLWLAKTGGREVFPNIIIVAGDMAGRGINFACFDDENVSNNWHVTHQVLLKAEGSSCASIIQGCRILGRYSDAMPLKLYTSKTIGERIRKGYDLCNELIEVITDTTNPLHREEYVNFFTDESCSMIPIRKSAKPLKFISKKGVKLNLVRDDEIAIPFCIEKRTDSRSSSEDDSIRGIIIIIPQSLYGEKIAAYIKITNSFIQHRMTDKWVKKLDFIRNFVAENPQEAARLNNNSWHFRNCSEKTDHENMKGLLFRNVGHILEMRYNQ